MAMRKVDPGGDLHEYLDKILDAAERSAGFVKQLLAFSRNQAITSKALDLNEVVTGTLSMLHRLIGEEIDLNWNPGAGLPPVLMDPTQVSQILVNLSVNARDAIDGAGTITIKTRLASFDEVSADEAAAAPGLYVVLEVRDTGCGVPPNILEHIFEPFLPPRNPRVPFSAWPPCTASSSRTTASSAQPANRNGGCVFRITQPAHHLPLAQLVEESPRQVHHGAGETILVGDNDAEILELTEVMLGNQGYIQGPQRAFTESGAASAGSTAGRRRSAPDRRGHA